jgi:hypothetical protein
MIYDALEWFGGCPGSNPTHSAFNGLVRHCKFELTFKVVSQIQIPYFLPERPRI